MKRLFYLPLLCLIFSACGMMQQVIKSSFPYTTTLTIPASAGTDGEHVAISRANSFDQNFSKSGNNATRINKARIVSAKIQSAEPADYNIGNLSSVRIYMSKANGSDEVLVASKMLIPRNAGNVLILDTDNSNFLDEHVREPYLRIRMIYKLRNREELDATLRVVLSVTADKQEK